jgi:hypothetical protein
VVWRQRHEAAVAAERAVGQQHVEMWMIEAAKRIEAAKKTEAAKSMFEP